MHVAIGCKLLDDQGRGQTGWNGSSSNNNNGITMLKESAISGWKGLLCVILCPAIIAALMTFLRKTKAAQSKKMRNLIGDNVTKATAKYKSDQVVFRRLVN